MAGPVSHYARGAGLGLLLCGSLLLFAHPALTAPGAKPKTPGRSAGLPASPARREVKLPQPVVKPAPSAPQPAEPPPGNRIMSVSEVRTGMKGYGLTVFRGTTIERFDVEVLGVLPKMNMGRPLVLARVSGGPISERGANLIQGMSGSPIYLEGKLVGALSMGNGWGKDPIVMITPIEDMLEALDPKLSRTPAGQVARDLRTGPSAVTVNADGSVTPDPTPPAAIKYGGQTFQPFPVAVSASGLSGTALERLTEALKPFNVTVVQGMGSGSLDKPIKAELKPGAAMGMALMTGDIDISALGTVTYRNGDEILGFGHPWNQIGAGEFGLTTAWIHDVFPGFNVSSKLWSPGELVGSVTQDRPFGVAGTVGKLPRMVPLTCSVSDLTTGRSRVFKAQSTTHPLLIGRLLPIAVLQSVQNIRPVPGETRARIALKVETEGAGTITRNNVVFDPVQIENACIRDVVELLDILQNNEFRRVPVKSMEVSVTLEECQPTASVDRIFLSRDRFEPGEEAEVGIVLRPYRKEPVVLKSKIRIPESATNGRVTLLVQGGATRVNLTPLLTGSSSPLGAVMPPDASLDQVLKRYSEREQGNQLVVYCVFSTAAVNVNGERLSQLPSTIVDVMRSSRSTGFKIERDYVRKLEDTNYVVQGLQMLDLTVQKPEHLERPKPADPSSGGSRTASLGSAGPSRAFSSDEDFDEISAPSTIELLVDGKPKRFRLTPEIGEDEPLASGGKGEKKNEKKPVSVSGKGGKSTPAAVKDAKPSDPAPAAKSAKEPEVKFVGRAASTWLQTSRPDFERGTFVNTAVTTSGEVRLAPTLRLLHESAEQYVWSVTGFGGHVYAGTGNGGNVLKVARDGKTEVFFRTGELAVHALARDRAGNLYAGTSPGGKVFKITPEGQATELLSLRGGSPGENGARFVLSLAVLDDGTVYAGTGPQAQIYRIRPGAPAEELCRLPSRSVMCLLPADEKTLYAGTAEDGILYRVRTDAGVGHATVVFDSDQPVINGLTRDPQGNLYVALAPSGTILRIEEDGSYREVFTKGKGALYGLIADRNGNLYTCNGNSILRVEQDGDATILSDSRKGDFTCLAWDDEGRLVAGSSNVGCVYRLAPSPSGTFESTVHDAKQPARWGRLRYSGVLPTGGVLTVQTRSGNTPEPDESWSPWEAPRAQEGGVFVASPMARYLQYRVLMQAESGTPALREMAISYLPRNRPPKITLSAPIGGEIWKGSPTLKWTATDPDGDTLTYEVQYSGDGGRTWKPVGAKPKTAVSSTPAPTAPARPSRASANAALDRYKEQLELDAALTPAQRKESFEKAKSLLEKYFAENPSAPESPAPAPAKPGAEAPAGSGITREAQIVWDTTTVEDGVYLLRVVASDQASNPGEPLRAVAVSEPFIISNTAPQLFVFERGITVDEKKVAAISGFATGRVSLKGAQYRLGSGDWSAIDAEDGIWDSAFEAFRFSIPDCASGTYELEVRLIDMAGNSTTSKVKFKVP